MPGVRGCRPATFSVSGSKVRTASGQEVNLPYPVWECVEIGALLVVVLNVPVRKDYPRNVVAIGADARIVWQIAPVQSVVHHGAFVGVERNGDVVRAHHFDGWAYDLDPATGRIVGSKFLK